jgi:hypothetical protein
MIVFVTGSIILNTFYQSVIAKVMFDDFVGAPPLGMWHG